MNLTWQGWKHSAVNQFKPPLGVDRPAPVAGKQSPYTTGVEIELFEQAQPGDTPGMPLAGFTNSPGSFTKTSIFNNPDAINTFRDPTNPASEVIASVSKLRYRVRFRYPVNPAVDTEAVGPWVSSDTQYLLDTPVFDDISITFFSKPRILAYRAIME